MPNSFNTPIATDSIRVGYVDPTLGYVTDITICEANDYAYKNPGTVFVFRDGRNNIKYLTINEVNKLTPNDIVSTASTCGGYQEIKECGPPKIQIFGGGGIGAVGNPVVGQDGAILAVDLVSGGFGYQFPPITQAKDDCQYGSGAVLRAIIGETVEAYETFEGEEDFEEYELCEDNSVGYAIRYGPNGENLGFWDPDSYTSTTSDPIQNEIEKYQESLTKYKNPFWTTRKKLPVRISSLGKDFSPYQVTFPTWNDFMNSYAISPVPPSNVSGSDFAGRIFTFEWEEYFPYDGEYVFRGLCDNLAKLYIDGDLISDLKGFNDSVQPIQKTLKSGFYLIRIDLLNIPIITNTPTTSVTTKTSKIDAKFIKRGKDFYLDVTGSGTGEVDLLMEINDSAYTAGLAAKEIIIPSDKGKVKFKRETGTPKVENIKKTINVTGGQSYGPIQILGATVGVKSPKLNSNKIALYDADGTDENIKFIIADVKSDKTTTSTSSSATANVASITTQNPKDYVIPEAKIIEKKGQYYIKVDGTGRVTITFKMDVNDADYIAGIAASEIKVPSENGTISLKRKTYLPNAYEKEDVIKKSGKFIGGKTYGPIEIINQNPTGLPPKLTGSKKLELRDADGADANIKFEIDKIEAQKSTVSNVVAGTVVSSKSWNENPMGISVTIDAPPQPVPQEKPPVQEGRCPPNPIWSTRFPSAKENWYPVRFSRWSKFLNRYALSPVKPLDTPGSDSGGISYSNSWTVNAPFRGYYKVRGEVDDIAKIYVDGNLVLDLSRRVGKTSGSEKILLEEGNHVIKVDVENYSSESFSTINQKIFSTLDWQSPLTSTSSKSNIKAKFIQKGKDYYLDVSGSGSGEISFVMDVNDAPYIAGLAAKEVIIPSDSGKLKFIRTNASQRTDIAYYTMPKEETIKKSGKFTGGKTYGPIQILGATLGAGTPRVFNNKLSLLDAAGTDENIKLEISKIEQTGNNSTSSSSSISSGTSKDGVTYEGPELFHHIQTTGGPTGKGWGDFMNKYSVSPKVFRSISEPDERINGTFTLTWKNVKFPEDGDYRVKFQADNIGVLKIGGKQVEKTTDFYGDSTTIQTNITAGTYDIIIELTNIKDRTNKFSNNPTGTSLIIEKDISVRDSLSKSWTENPIGVSAVLISPPCPKKISGRGVVEEVIVEEPGNGYLPPQDPTSPSQYPVIVRLKEVRVANGGINYEKGLGGRLKITPDNGAKLTYTTNELGVIDTVTVVDPGTPFTNYPRITLPSETGVNAKFTPVFEVIRDPLDPAISPNNIIQVTDLVGLKQTGYVEGRPYYGAVYYEEGVRYAGYYKTIGTPIVVYNTLQESITAKVTTPASAIERSGTDVTSNDPRLNIPGTPENLI
jgi:hypothetical protein